MPRSSESSLMPPLGLLAVALCLYDQTQTVVTMGVATDG